MREVNPTAQIDEEVEEMLLQLADDFIDSTLNAACALAKHRHSPTVELRDVQLHLGIFLKMLFNSFTFMSFLRISRDKAE